MSDPKCSCSIADWDSKDAQPCPMHNAPKTESAPREFYVAKDPSGTDGYIYSDRHGAEKRLSSVLKRPVYWANPEIIHVIEYSAYAKLKTEIEQLKRKEQK